MLRVRLQASCGRPDTTLGLTNAIAMLTGVVSDAKVIIIMTDGSPQESVPYRRVVQHCQSIGITTRRARLSCKLSLSKYAQSTTGTPAPAGTGYLKDTCMEPLGALVITVGINVGQDQSLRDHFKAVASAPDKFLDVDLNNPDDYPEQSHQRPSRRRLPPADAGAKLARRGGVGQRPRETLHTEAPGSAANRLKPDRDCGKFL